MGDGIGGARRNLELKARDRDPARSVDVCAGLGGDDRGTLNQRDTYFETPRGRLKLREEPGAAAHLIAYERPDLADHSVSRYRLVEVPANLLVTLLAGDKRFGNSPRVGKPVQDGHDGCRHVLMRGHVEA